MKKVFKVIIITMVIMTLTLVNFISVGVNMISYAAELMNADVNTNNKNIQFAAYFMNDKGEKLKSTEESIQKDDLKIYMEVEVKKEGYFNGEITIDSSNFNLKPEKLSEGINKIEGNKITLNQINAGQKVVIEVGITPIKDDEFDLGLLNMASKISLNGYYKNSTEKDIKIQATREVELNLVSPFLNENEGIELNYEIITNKTAVYNNENKKIVQLLVKSGVSNNAYPIKNTKIEVSVPELEGKLPEEVLASTKGTLATNGNGEYTLSEDEWKYNKSDKKVTIDVDNKAQDNKISWNKTGKDQYILTFIYNDGKAELNKSDIVVNSQITLYDAKSTKLKSNAEIVEEDISNLGKIISVSTREQESSIYKGKIYSKNEREITSVTQIDVNLNNVAEEIYIEDQAATMVKNPENQEELLEHANVNYRTTTINKEQLIKTLGENFVIEITKLKDRMQLAQITKDTEADENGNIVITYPDGVQAIEIKTNKPENIGKIELTNRKVITATDKEIAKLASEVKTSLKGKFKTKTEEVQIDVNTSSVKLEEPQTSAKLEVSRNDLSTVIENKGVEIKAILESSKEANDLYKNPQVKIEFPEEIQELKVNNIKVLYEEQLQVESAKLFDENGKKVILISLKGEQTNYKDVAIDGTTIIINADIKLDRKATSSEKEIKLIYSNENVTSYKNGGSVGEEAVKTEIVSPKGLITVNNIENLGVQTIGDTAQTNVMLEKGKEAKTVKVETEIINNNDSGISNIAILGTFPTNNSKINDKESNIETKIASNVVVENTNAKVYYTENENATAEISDSENEWKEEIEDNANVKKYLIVLDSMENAEVVKASYDVQIPANLEYNEEAYTGYSVDYTNITTGIQATAKSTIISTETGIGPKIESSLSATISGEKIENNAEIKTGEVIKYVTEIKNIGSEDATGVSAKVNVPEGTTLVQPEKNYQYSGASYYEEIENQEYLIDIGTIKAGETKTASYEVRVKSDVEDGKTITSKTTVNYGEAKQETNEVSNIVRKGNLRVSVKRVGDTSGSLYPGSTVEYYAIIENTTDSTQENVTVKTNLENKLDVNSLTLVKGMQSHIKDEVAVDDGDTSNVDDWGEDVEEGNEVYNSGSEIVEEDIEYSDNINIGSLDAKEAKVLVYSCTIKETQDKNIGFSTIASDSSNNTYRSNKISSALSSFSYTIKQTSTKDGQTLKSGEEIQYNINIKNTGGVEEKAVILTDEVPKELTITSVKINNEEVYAKEDLNAGDTIYSDEYIESIQGEANTNSLEYTQIIDPNSEANIVITAKVKDDVRYKAQYITNKAELYVDSNTTLESDEITNILEAKLEEDVDYEYTPGAGNGGNGGGNEEKPNESTKHMISGIAWVDEDANGKRESSEKVLGGIEVKLLNTDTNQLENNISDTTDENGRYILENIPSGNYIVVFNYDTSKYKVTQYKADGIEEKENSNVISKELDLGEGNKSYAVTDMLKIENDNIANVNIGLIALKNFDIQLEKYINKIIVQNNSGTTTYNYNEEKLAKVEIASKYLNNSTVVVEYGIKVTNCGEVDAYVTKVADYLAEGMKFSSELNKDWYQSGNNIYNNSLANEKIAAGESKILTLTVTKAMTEDNTGRINNTAEIAEQYNDLGFEDTNSTPGNKAQGENDMGVADVIISIKTGAITYIMLTITILAIIGAGAYFIVKKVLKKEI